MEAALEVRNVTKRLGKTIAVRDATFEVPRGSIFGLIGPNGSGKSTTLRCALGLLRPDQGEARVLGVSSRRVPELRGRVGVAFDSADLVEGLSLRENLRWAMRLSGLSPKGDGGRSVEDALALVGMAGFEDRRASGLSLGQRRRAAIARALVGSPELVLFDEPLSGLDVGGVREMLALFTRLREAGITMVLSSHRLHEMEEIADHVAVLFRGRILYAGGLDELCGEHEFLRIEVQPLQQARGVLGSLEGLGAVEVDETRGSLRVEPGAVPAARVCRALVEGGCEVSALGPERRGLQRAFEELVEEARRLAENAA